MEILFKVQHSFSSGGVAFAENTAGGKTKDGVENLELDELRPLLMRKDTSSVSSSGSTSFQYVQILMKREFLDRVSEKDWIPVLWKSVQWEPVSMQTYRCMRKRVVGFRNFANAPKN